MANSILLLTILVVIFNFSTARVNNVNWCQKSCRGYDGSLKSHVMCLYPTDEPSPTCGKVIRNRLRRKEIDRIVKLHNYLRYRVYSGREKRGYPSGPQPSSRHWTRLRWNKDLAAIAQRWINQCKYEHSQCHNLGNDYRVGQNIGYCTPGNPSEEVGVGSFVFSWYNEVVNFNKDNVASYNSFPNNGTTQHYTTMIWANTTKIGCGYMKHEVDGGRRYRTLLVCNYGPQGNMLRQRVY